MFSMEARTVRWVSMRTCCGGKTYTLERRLDVDLDEMAEGLEDGQQGPIGLSAVFAA